MIQLLNLVVSSCKLYWLILLTFNLLNQFFKINITQLFYDSEHRSKVPVYHRIMPMNYKQLNANFLRYILKIKSLNMEKFSYSLFRLPCTFFWWTKTDDLKHYFMDGRKKSIFGDCLYHHWIHLLPSGSCIASN